MSSNKTHYRKVFKSDHLGTADLEDLIETGSNLIFNIARVQQEIGAKVAGRKINANIAYFKEKIKPLVLNATNSKAMKTITNSSFIEDWNNVAVQLYIDPTASLKGEIVGGVRISPNKVNPRQVIERGTKAWGNAITAYKRDGDFNAVLARADISQADMQFIADGVASGSI
jgi:hypothetical protein